MLRVDPQPEIKDGTGMTLLHYAAIASTDACTRFLLSQDVNPLNTSPTVSLCELMDILPNKSVQYCKTPIYRS